MKQNIYTFKGSAKQLLELLSDFQETMHQYLVETVESLGSEYAKTDVMIREDGSACCPFCWTDNDQFYLPEFYTQVLTCQS